MEEARQHEEKVGLMLAERGTIPDLSKAPRQRSNRYDVPEGKTYVPHSQTPAEVNLSERGSLECMGISAAVQRTLATTLRRGQAANTGVDKKDVEMPATITVHNAATVKTGLMDEQRVIRADPSYYVSALFLRYLTLCIRYINVIHRANRGMTLCSCWCSIPTLTIPIKLCTDRKRTNALPATAELCLATRSLFVISPR